MRIRVEYLDGAPREFVVLAYSTDEMNNLILDLDAGRTMINSTDWQQVDELPHRANKVKVVPLGKGS